MEMNLNNIMFDFSRRFLFRSSLSTMLLAYTFIEFQRLSLECFPKSFEMYTSVCAAQVVPESLRSSVYAFDRCFEGAISALSNPLVGIIAERCFGYVTQWQGISPERQLSNARALGNGLLVRFLD